MDLIVFVSVYLAFSLYLAYLSHRKGINWIVTLLISLIFTPVGGFIRYQSAKPIRVYKEARYKCRRCNYYFTEPYHHCPHCEAEGHKIPLKKVFVDMT